MTSNAPLIFQFETDEFYHYTANLVLFNFGLEPARWIKDRKELREIIEEIVQGRVKPDLAIIDTYIGLGQTDGQRIATKLRELVPGIKVIGYSIIPTDDWADFVAVKSNKDNTKTIVKALEEALDRKFNYSQQADPEVGNI